MKHCIIIFFTITLALGITSCGKKDEKTGPVKSSSQSIDTTEIKGESLGEADSKNLQLTYQPEKGKTYFYNLASVTEDQGEMTGDTVINQKMTQHIKYFIGVKINDVEDDGAVDANFVIQSVSVDVEMDNGKKIHYETGGKLDSATLANFIDYEAIVNNPFSARFKPSGEILEVYKSDKILNKIISLRKMDKSKINAEELANFQKSVSDGALRPIVNQLFRNLAAAPVSKSETWSMPQPPLNLQFMLFENKIEYKLEDVTKVDGDVIAAIGSKLLTTVQINPELKKKNITISKAEMNGAGKVFFNLAKHVIQKTKSTMTVFRIMSAQEPTPKGMQTIKQTVTTKISNFVELVSVE